MNNIVRLNNDELTVVGGGLDPVSIGLGIAVGVGVASFAPESLTRGCRAAAGIIAGVAGAAVPVALAFFGSTYIFKRVARKFGGKSMTS